MIFSLSTTIFKPTDIDSLLDDIKFVKNNKKISYANVSCSFDIEVSSFDRYDPDNDENEKCSCMYCFVFGINGKCIIGRTWEEALYLFNKVSEYYQLDNEKRMIFYVHNLAYEFQFIRKLFQWDKIFSLSQRKPLQCITDIGIEFRCSYLLSGYSLETVGKNLTKYKVDKMVGDLNYDLIRHSETPMTDKEYGYVLHDGLVVMAYIQEQIEDLGNILKLPLTKTGFVRNYCRNQCMYEGGHKHNIQKFVHYNRIMKSLTINSVKEYEQLKRAFQGGFTHANAFYTNKVSNDVTSYDFTSSYPAVMIAEKFPMSSGRLINIHSFDEFIKYLKLYCCLFDITFINLESSTSIEHPLSSSKCWATKNINIDNGRIVDADEVSTTITETDFFIIRKFYKWKSIKIKNFRIYKKGYLPHDFVKSILDLYVKKTTLKGVEGMEVEYMKSKENLNSCYGMCVTDICRPEITYENNEWGLTQPDIEESLQKYNNSKRRFLFYAWGIWVTAYARRNLFSGIYEFGDDYIYSDTDSIKARNVEKHLDYINNYNNNMLSKLEKAMIHHHLPLDLIQPKTIEGKTKIIGFWDYDGLYKKFKTLGAKRYMVQYDDNHVSLTVSGLNKKITVPYLEKQCKKNQTPFDLFKDGLFVPKEYTGKNIHTYIDYEQSGEIIDYLGNKSTFHELSGVHMEGAEYSLSLSDSYIDYLMGIMNYID